MVLTCIMQTTILTSALALPVLCSFFQKSPTQKYGCGVVSLYYYLRLSFTRHRECITTVVTLRNHVHPVTQCMHTRSCSTVPSLKLADSFVMHHPIADKVVYMYHSLQII